MFHRLSGGVSRSSRLPEAILLVLGSFLAPPAIAQVTMDVNINQTGAFIPQGPTGGVFTNQLIYRSTVQAPLGQVIEVGGTGGGTHSSSRSSSAGIGRSVDSGQGGGTSIQMRVIPVPVDPTGIRERPLPQASGRQLLAELTSDDPSGRASALAEIGRRRWSDRARQALTRRVSTLLADPQWRVAAAAARTLGYLADPVAPALMTPYLDSRDTDRVVAILQVLGRIGTPDCLPAVKRQVSRVDLEVSTTASRAADSISRRARLASRSTTARPAAPAVPGP